MTSIKICGIRNLDDALVAADAGADYIGLVFVPEQRRSIAPDAAGEIIAGLRQSGTGTPQVVGLFADQPVEEVNRIVETCGLDLVQLCGQETPGYCARVEARVIKVFHVASWPGPEEAVTGLAADLEERRLAGNLVTLDSGAGGSPGGAGVSFDWEIAARLARAGHSFLLAGGLDPDNVGRAIAQVQPWGVDVSSGVETGGLKDPQKIRDFIRNARRAAQGN